MAAGDPDLAFSSDGRTMLNFPGAAMTITDTAVAPDGKVLVGGNRGANMAVARLNSNGAIDTTFGNGGLYESTRRSAVTSLAIQADGKIVLGLGGASGFEHDDLAVGRLLASGAGLDPAFGDNGIADAGRERFNSSTITDVAVQRDGMIIGSGDIEDSLFVDHDFAVVRYDANGSLDPTFDGDGVTVHDLGNIYDASTAVTIDYNGNIDTNPLYGTIVVVGGEFAVASRFQILRLRPNGTPDSTFDGDGKVTSPNLSGSGIEYATDVVVQPGGKVVVGGTAFSPTVAEARNFLIARYNSNGFLDPSFGLSNTGMTELDLGGRDEVGGLAIGYHNTLGNLIVGGSRNGQFALVALRPNGQLDTRFSGDGILTTTIPGHATGLFATGGLFPPIRKLIIAGGNQVARYIDVGSVISIGTFQPNMYEQGEQGTSFIVSHSDPLPFPETIFLTTTGNATPRGPNRDFNSQNILYGDGQTTTTQVMIPAGDNFVNVILKPIDDLTIEGDENITFTVGTTAAYDAGVPSATTLVVRDNDNLGGPVVIASSFVWQTAPQRVRFSFSKDVSASISAADFQFTGPGPIPPRTFSYDDVTNTATLSFNGILRSGNFSVRAIAAGITSAQGEPMPADHVFNFSFLNGDTDQNGVINFDDYARIDNGFNNNLIGYSNGDFNYDGVINFDDYAIIDLAFNSQ